MSGFMEILLIVAIILVIFLLPGRMRERQENRVPRPHRGLKPTGWKRLAILASFLWPTLLALHLKPWNDPHWPAFLYLGIGPVVLAWGIGWVLSGFRKRG